MACYPKPEGLVSVAVLVCEHVAILVAYLLQLRKTYKSLDLQHPIFACVFQEVAVLAFCQLIHIASLIFNAILGDEYEVVYPIYLAALVMALQFHQLTWFAIACLRYFLINGPSLMDYKHIQRYVLASIWLVELLYLPLCQVPWLLLLLQRVENLDWMKPVVVPLLIFLVTNVPDFLSMAVYRQMTREAKDKVHVVQAFPDQELGQPSQDPQELAAEEFGGIWVGPTVEVSLPHSIEESQSHTSIEMCQVKHLNEEKMSNHSSELSQASTLKPQQAPVNSSSSSSKNNSNSSSSKNNSNISNNNSNSNNSNNNNCNNSNNNNNNNNQLIKLQSKLRWHVYLCLFDFALVPLNLILCQGEVFKVLGMSLRLVILYWLPLVVLNNNFGWHLGLRWQTFCNWSNGNGPN